MEAYSSSQRDEQEIERVSEDANRAYDALKKAEEREHRLRFELETLLSLETSTLEEHGNLSKGIEVHDREIQFLDRENNTLEARAALAGEKLSNTRRLSEEKKLKVQEMQRKFEERREKLQKHQHEIKERSARIRTTVQQVLVEYRSMPLCKKFFEQQNKLVELREKHDEAKKKLEEAEAKLVRIRKSNKEKWQQFVRNCVMAAENYKKCKEEAISKYQSTSRRAQDILDRHYKKRDPGVAAPSPLKYISAHAPFLKAWSPRHATGVPYSAKKTTALGQSQNSQRSLISNFNSTPFSPYEKTRELMEKLKAMKSRPAPISHFPGRKRNSGNDNDQPAAKKPADATSVLKNFSFQVPAPRQDSQNSVVKKYDHLCGRQEQKARQSGSTTSVEHPTHKMTSQSAVNESRSLSAEMKSSIITTSVQNLQPSPSNDGFTAPSTPLNVSIPEQSEFLSQPGSKLVSLNNMNVSINVNVSQNNAVSTSQQIIGDGNGTGFFGSPGFNTSRAPTPVPSPRDFSGMVGVGHQIASLVPGVSSSIGSSPTGNFQQQGFAGATTSSPNFLSMSAGNSNGTSGAADFFMGLPGLSNVGMDTGNCRSSPDANASLSGFFERFKPTPNGSANGTDSFCFNPSFGQSEGNMLDFPGFGLQSDTDNGSSRKEDFNSILSFF